MLCTDALLLLASFMGRDEEMLLEKACGLSAGSSLAMIFKRKTAAMPVLSLLVMEASFTSDKIGSSPRNQQPQGQGSRPAVPLVQWDTYR